MGTRNLPVDWQFFPMVWQFLEVRQIWTHSKVGFNGMNAQSAMQAERYGRRRGRSFCRPTGFPIPPHEI